MAKLIKSGKWLLVLAYCLYSAAGAETRIAILDFELKDLTMKSATPVELERTARLKPLLEKELAGAGYTIVDIDRSAQQRANSGVGYLFDHHDAATELAERYAADYVLVGRLHKPSFLFVYLMGNLVKVSNGKLVGRFIVESKGGAKKLTGKAIETLASEVDAILDQRYRPPSSSSQR
ncbi:DUF2380 domain-containing protein [Methylomarinum sp. Ch1-1]|uniref:DUF2380 domain-containing protein n=1 Tax=Methylomarinum roseum TaxID=3067653 RepID=A0AAU7NTJ3_9GAMM|nr:DUF2380 domain-containing protein [Methylomarinum sp. Ch1-1]MDP4519730.1 DUF2380 domain-containing protein [Methylomarinum sp. Ch1-1]